MLVRYEGVYPGNRYHPDSYKPQWQSQDLRIVHKQILYSKQSVCQMRHVSIDPSEKSSLVPRLTKGGMNLALQTVRSIY
jgi:hypothetical protein